MQSPKKPTMTSREAAALLLSGGKTADVEEAELINAGKLIDPDKLVQSHFRRMMGFDFSVTEDKPAHKWIVRDEDHETAVTCAIADDEDKQAALLAKACMKLKKLHDKAEVLNHE